MSRASFIGYEVMDARGETLGNVTKETQSWVLVEKSGLLHEATVVMTDEFLSVEVGRIRLRIEQAEMENRPDRPGVDDARR